MASGHGRHHRLDQLDTEVSEVTTLLKNNMEKVMDRGERLDSLQERSEDLQSNSIRFSQSSRQLRKKMCCKNAKLTLCLIVIAVVVIAAIILIVLLTLKPWDHKPKPGNQTVNAIPPTRGYTVTP